MPIFSRLVQTLLAWTVGSFRATSRSLSAAISLGAVLIGPGVALQVGSPFPTLPIHTKKHQPTISKTSPSLLKWLLKQQLILFF